MHLRSHFHWCVLTSGSGSTVRDAWVVAIFVDDRVTHDDISLCVDRVFYGTSGQRLAKLSKNQRSQDWTKWKSESLVLRIGTWTRQANLPGRSDWLLRIDCRWPISQQQPPHRHHPSTISTRLTWCTFAIFVFVSVIRQNQLLHCLISLSSHFVDKQHADLADCAANYFGCGHVHARDLDLWL